MDARNQWFAVYTRPRWEKKVAGLLTRKKIENYCPLNKVVRQWTDRKKTIYEPLFTSYVFVCASESDFTEIRQTDGILNFVYWLGKPAVIKHDEIDTIKDLLNNYCNVGLEKINVNVNDNVKIIHGPLLSREGKVIEVMNNSIKVLLPSLGYALVAHVQRTHIEKVVTAPAAKLQTANKSNFNLKYANKFPFVIKD